MRTIRILKITIAPILMLLLLGACSKKPLIEQNSIEVRSNEAVSIEAAGGYERYSWRQISGTAVDIEDAKSRVLRFIAPDVTKKEVLLFELRVYTGNIELRDEARVAVLPLKSGMDTEDGNGTKKSDENGTDREDSATDTDKESGTSPIQSLTLQIEKTTINRDSNTTYTLKVKDRTGKTKNITESIEWIVTPSDAVKIEGSTITALKDTDVTIQARYKGRLSNPVTLHIYWEVDGHRLPPEPDPKINNATLLGVDSNKNGVRDDVERWIYRTYKEYIPCKDVPVSYKLDSGGVLEGYEKVCEDRPVPYHPVVRAVAMQGARAAQIIIEHPEKARETLPMWNAALDCDIDVALYLKNQLAKPIMRRLEKIQFNTAKRARAYAKFNFYLSGGVYEDKSEEFYGCDEKVKKYLKDLR